MITLPTNWQRNDKLLAFVNETLASKQPFAWILAGLPGRGKTAIAELVFSALEQDYKPNWKLSAKQLYEHYMKAVSSNDANKHINIGRVMAYFTSPLFLLDDLGVETNTEASRSFFAGLFSTQNDAFDEGKLNRSIITTNFGPEEISARYGDRVMSRIYSHYTILQFNGDEDFRKRDKKVVDV